MRSAVAVVVGLNHQPRAGAQLATTPTIAATATPTSQPVAAFALPCSERAPANISIPVRSFIFISLEHPGTSEFQPDPISTAPTAPTEVERPTLDVPRPFRSSV